MLGYQLFYSVHRSKKPCYTETKFFSFEKDAISEACQLCQCSNVEFVSVRFVEVKSISLSVYKKPDNYEILEPYSDLSISNNNYDKEYTE